MTYFGHNQAGALGAQYSAIYTYRYDAYCPGSGTFAVDEISAYVERTGEIGNIRMALYDVDKPLLVPNYVCQGIAEVAVDGNAEWYGHLDRESITPNPAILFGGHRYAILFSYDTSWEPRVYYDSGPADVGGYYCAGDRTGGFETDFMPGNWLGWDIKLCFRVGATEYATGKFWPVILRLLDQQRS